MSLNGFDSIESLLKASSTASSNTTLVARLDATSDAVLSQETMAGDSDPLDKLTFATDSLKMLYLLTSRLSSQLSQPVQDQAQRQTVQQTFDRLLGFIELCTESQVRAAPKKVRQLGETLYRLGVSLNRFDVVVQPIVRLTMRLHVPSFLSVLHATALQVCLLARRFQDALVILQSEITNIDPQRHHVNIQDLLLYMYYGGMVYAGLKDFASAADFFGMAVTVPAPNVCSRIQIEAYKKHYLVSLLAHGKAVPFGHSVSATVVRVFRDVGKPYVAFSSAFQSLNYARVYSELQANASTFEHDQNLGLVKQCLAAVHRRLIRNLTNTYLTLSLADIARLASMEQADNAAVELLIRDMIAKSEVRATIDKERDMVIFSDDEQQPNQPHTMTTIEQQLDALASLGKRLQSAERSLAVNPVYLGKVQRGAHSAVEQARSALMQDFDEMEYFDE
ncbi:hypothetical protein RI367_001200 [Sorochytrium milnesiophthora]